MVLEGEESAAELALEAALSFLDDYEAIAAEWLAPQAQNTAGTALDGGVLPAIGGLSAVHSVHAVHDAVSAASSAPHEQNKPKSRARMNSSSPTVCRDTGATAGPRNSNRARDERKYELIYLRRHAEELEAQLRELESRAKSVQGHSTNANKLDGVVSSSPGAYLVGCKGSKTWKEAARRLCAERQKSEKENIRLRLLVDRQLKTARRLEKLVVRKHGVKIKNAGLEPADLLEGGGVSVGGTDGRDPRELRRSLLMDMMPSPVLFESTEQTFDMLLRGIEHARAEVDSVFRANGLSAIDSAYRSAKVEQDSTNGTVLEFVASKLLKSDMNSTHQAAWRHFGYSQPQMPYRTLSEYHDERKDLDFAEDTIAASYGLELFNGLESVKFDEWRVLRRFVDADRVILVLCTLAEVAEFAGVPARGIRVLERAYVVLRPSSGDGTESKSTLMQTCYRTQPVMYKDTPGLEETVATLTDFLFAFVAGTVSVNHQMIEKALRVQSAQSRTDTECRVSAV